MSFLDDELSTLFLPQELLNTYLTWDALKRIAADITTKEVAMVKKNYLAASMVLGESMDALDIRVPHMERSLANTRGPRGEDMMKQRLLVTVTRLYKSGSYKMHISCVTLEMDNSSDRFDYVNA